MKVVDAGRRVGMVLIAGVLSLNWGCAGPTAEPGPTDGPDTTDVAPSPTLPSRSPAEGVVLTATVHDVVGLDGGWLAGILYEGVEMLEDDAVGGFGTRIDADPFSTTTTVNTPYLFAPVFPNVSDEPLLLEPGTYTLSIWADEVELTAFNRWTPGLTGEEGGIYVCSTTVEVAESDVSVSISGVPPERADAWIPPCTLE